MRDMKTIQQAVADLALGLAVVCFITAVATFLFSSPLLIWPLGLFTLANVASLAVVIQLKKRARAVDPTPEEA